MKLPGEIIYALAGIATYLVAAIPFGFVLARALRGVDLRTVGSGNIGATNAARVLGTGWFFPIFALDFLKGFAPVFWLAPWIARRFPCDHCPYLPAMIAIFCGLTALAGHLFPVWLDFKGGKGVATGVGVVFGVDWIAGAVAMGIFLLAFAATRIVSVGSILGALAAPAAHAVAGGRFFRDPTQLHIVTAFLGFITVVVIYRHRANIGRLLRGQERRVGKAAPPKGDEAGRPSAP